ncbi:YggT family protein [Wohlfahrtiimonas chitiniclastica]|uniref:YggT family protein n=1 Tax=Wohlfahrtiimonas chitiniclastica TaxID=400946 RepID=UPI0003647AA9|nr:YggT family protein [Wohlfahrtiimonas chitiniclastica]
MTGLLEFIIKLVFNCISFLVLLRFLLQCVKVNFFHPMIQILVRITNPIVLPVRRITPVFSSWDWSCMVVVLLAGIIKYVLIMLLMRLALSPLIVLGLILIEIIQDILTIYFYAIIGVSLCSWFRESPNARIVLDVLGRLTAPLMLLFNFTLRYRNIDFKPMVVLLAIMLVQSGLYIVKSFLLNWGL